MNNLRSVFLCKNNKIISRNNKNISILDCALCTVRKIYGKKTVQKKKKQVYFAVPSPSLTYYNISVKRNR